MMDKSASRLSKSTLSLSFVGMSIFIISVRQDFHINIIIPLSLSLSYPFAIILVESTQKKIVHIIYVLVFAASFGSMLSAANSVPTGYGDVWYYTRSTQQLLDTGFLTFPEDQSGIMVGLFILASSMSDIFNISILNAAKIIPVVTFLCTIIIYSAIASKYLSEYYHLMGLILFTVNWGIFRFSIEFRTLNMALPILLSILLIMIKINDNEGFRLGLSLATIILVMGVTIADFSVHFFFYALILSLPLSWIAASLITNMQYTKSSPQATERKIGFSILVVVMSIIFVFIYVEHVVDRVPNIVGFVPYLLDRFLSLFIYNDSLVSSTQSQGLEGRTFGNTVFIMRWTLRGLFLISAIVYFTRVYNQRSIREFWLFASGAIFGVLLIFGTVVGLPISPSRIFLFVAIPYGIVFANGFETIENISSYNGSGVIKATILIVLLLAVFTTMIKFPQEIVGETEPIRGNEPIDQVEYYNIGEADGLTYQYISVYSPSGVTVGDVSLKIFYHGMRSPSSKLVVADIGRTNMTPSYSNGTIYSNGKNTIYYIKSS